MASALVRFEGGSRKLTKFDKGGGGGGSSAEKRCRTKVDIIWEWPHYNTALPGRLKAVCRDLGAQFPRKFRSFPSENRVSLRKLNFLEQTKTFQLFLAGGANFP